MSICQIFGILGDKLKFIYHPVGSDEQSILTTIISLAPTPIAKPDFHRRLFKRQPIIHCIPHFV
jgi:hypothetical protein